MASRSSKNKLSFIRFLTINSCRNWQYAIKLEKTSTTLLDNDIPGLDESRLRGAGTRDAGPARACAVESSGLDEPDTSVGRATCIGRILIGMKDLCRDNGLDESVTAELVGRLAKDLCDFPI